MPRKKDIEYVVYVLCEPHTGEPRYVGKTGDLHRRMQVHYSDARHKQTPVNQWLDYLLTNGAFPKIMVVYSTINEDDAYFAESVIARTLMFQHGFNLLNQLEALRNLPYYIHDSDYVFEPFNARELDHSPMPFVDSLMKGRTLPAFFIGFLPESIQPAIEIK